MNAVRVLSNGEKKYNFEKVIATGYNTRMMAFEDLIPALLKAYDNYGKHVADHDSLYLQLADPIAILKNWDYHAAENSIATTLAIEWGQRLQTQINRSNGDDIVLKTKAFATLAGPNTLLEPLMITIKDLQSRFGKWQMAWGDINRFQRISASIENKFDDNKPSYPVGFASSAWGMLPSYNSRQFAGTNKRYGVNGNSFIAVVEFVRKDSFGGNKIKAKSLLAGGQSGNEQSPHFFDQGLMYSKGQFKDVLFYKEDVLQHAERTYHPGQ